MRRAASAALAVAILTGCSGGGSGDAGERAHVLRLGHVGNPGSVYDVSSAELARRVEARTDGRVRVEVFGSSQLGGDETLLQKLRLGTVDLALPSTVMSSAVGAFGLFEMPYLVRDREHMKALEEEIVWPVLAPLALERGYRILAVWENGFRHVTTSVRPIETPEDLRGVKLRTPRGVWRVKLFQGLGANPTPMAFSEVFVALQTGVMDGQENPLSQIVSARLHEVQDYLSLTGHVYTPAYLTAGASWSRLPEDLRAAVEEVARGMRDFVHAEAARLDEALLAELEAAGTRINRPDPAPFLAASQAVYDEFARTVPEGADLVARARALAAGSGERAAAQPAPGSEGGR